MSEHFKHHCLNCDCGNLEHQIWFRYFSDEAIKNREMYVEMHFPSVSFWHRLKRAARYLWNGKNGQFTDLVVTEKQIADLEDFFQHYRNDEPTDG